MNMTKPNSSDCFVADVEEAFKLLQQHELEAKVRYCAYVGRRETFGKTDWKKLQKRICWSQLQGENCLIPFDGVPFMSQGKLLMECRYGPDRNIAMKAKIEEDYAKKCRDNPDVTIKRGTKHSVTTKFGCPAQVKFVEVVKFPDYEINKNTRSKRERASQALRLDLENKKDIRAERRIYYHFPTEHCNHPFGEKRPRRFYDQSELEKALELVKKEKSTIKKAAQLCHVPESALKRNLKKDSTAVRVKGSPLQLPADEEKLLKEHVINMAEMGTVLSQSDIIKLATKTAIFLGLKSEDSKPFSNHWYRCFLSRWPELKGLRKSKNPSLNTVRDYYNALNRIVKKYSLADKPHFMFYFDETGFHVECETKSTSSSVEGGTSVLLEDSNLMVTVMSAGSALGQYIPPYFICNGSRSVADLQPSALPGSCYRVTETGRSSSDLFLDFLENHLLKYARPEGQHILLFYPCQSTCISTVLSHLALTKGVVLFGLPQGQATLQPQSVTSFDELKNTYLTEFQAQMSENLMELKERHQLCKLVSASYLHAFTPLNLISAFRETGLYPINRKKIRESYSVTESDQKSDAALLDV